MESENIRPIPRIPTKAMIKAGEDRSPIADDWAEVREVWIAMWDASPPIPAASAPKGAEPIPLTWPSDQGDPEHIRSVIEMLRSRDLELPEFHAHQLPIANMLAIMANERASHGAEPTTVALQYAIEAWQRDESERVKYGGLQVPSHAEAASLLGRCRNYFGDLPRASPTTGVDPGAETPTGEPHWTALVNQLETLLPYSPTGSCLLTGLRSQFAALESRASPSPPEDAKTAELLREIDRHFHETIPGVPVAHQLSEADRLLLGCRTIVAEASGVQFEEIESLKAANAALRDKLAERDANATRYVALRDAMYDESFDAYDPDALDAELDRRIARQSAQAAERKTE